MATGSTRGESSGETERTSGDAPLDDGHVRTVCGADDSPLLALEFGLEPGTCGWNPLEGRKVIIALNLGFDPLEPGEYPLQEPDDWAKIDPLGEEDWHKTSKGSVIIDSWDELGVSGSFTLDFEGLPLVHEDFAGIPFCDETMMCL